MLTDDEKIWIVEKREKWLGPLTNLLTNIVSKKRGWVGYSWNLKDGEGPMINIFMFYPGTGNYDFKRIDYHIECDKLDDKEYLRKTLKIYHDSQETKDYFETAEKRIYNTIVAYNKLFPYKKFMKDVTARLDQESEQTQEIEHER